MKSILFWSRFFALLLLVSLAQAQQAVPPLTAHVVDSTGTLNAQQARQLEDKLNAFEQSGDWRQR